MSTEECPRIKECPRLSEHPEVPDMLSAIDYELKVDQFVSHMGYLCSIISSEDEPELEQLCIYVYHLNKALRFGYKLTQDETEQINVIAEEYDEYVPRHIVVPVVDHVVAGQAHILRCEANNMLRLLHKLDGTYDFDRRLYGVFSALAQYFFGLACKYTEVSVPFDSRK